jgi:hypothetical protein
MKKLLLTHLIPVALIFCPNLSIGQTLQLGILSSFEAYTGAGAVSNDGTLLTGDAGTNIGIVTGCAGPTFNGNVYNANAITDQCKEDLFLTYIHLNDLFVTYPGVHTPAFGAGETIPPGVYSTGGAGSIGGDLTLDGGGDPNAYFVIKFNGAFTVGAGSTVTLINGAQSCNVFWIAEGAISVGANTVVKGTLLAHIGAVGIGADVNLEGRMLSLKGAITIGVGSVAIAPSCISTIPIFCETECTPAPEVDVLGILSDFALYTSFGAVANTSTSGIYGDIGSDEGAISGYAASVVMGSFHSEDLITAQGVIDLKNAYISLMALPNTVNGHTPAFGSGETITSGVYYIGSAGSLAGTITLDGQNNPNAIFVFKFEGAFTVAAASKMILTNGARRCNIFWIGGAGIPTGAISIGAAAVLKGTFLSHGGACSSGAGVFLAGRQLSTAGAVNTYSGVIYNNPTCVTSTPLDQSVIIATADTAGPINGLTGGTNVVNVLTNDTLNGASVSISQVNLTTITPNANLTLNPDGSIDVASNTPPGIYTLVYQICEVSDPTNCQSATVTISVVCVQSAEPATACYETATFNTNTCAWDVTGSQPAEPVTASCETATFNTNTCAWDVTGSQSAEPVIACYETATFNTNTCTWDVTGSQPTEPNTACYETATFNTNTCAWVVTGSQPAVPVTASCETATFNTNTCAWDVTGSQSAEPVTACYETATFNTNTCAWIVTGSQSAEPNTACYETATFNTNTCAWVVTGSQSAEPVIACYETATFNTCTCTWDITGSQSTEPIIACYETATFNTCTCTWDVTGSQSAEPNTACNETATFDTITCTWVVTSVQSIEPCGPRFNPGNSDWQFCLITPSGTYSRDDLANNSNFTYSGIATSVYFKPIAGGGDVIVNGNSYAVQNGSYYLFTGNLTVDVSSSHPGSMGHWEICLTSDSNPNYGNGNNRPISPCEDNNQKVMDLNETNIYPYPTKGFITVDFGEIEGAANYALYTFEGRIIEQEQNVTDIYPNPTKGFITVDFGKIKGAANYALYTFEGRMIQQEQNVTDRTVSIDLSNECSGVYLLKIKNQNTVNVHRVVKQ